MIIRLILNSFKLALIIFSALSLANWGGEQLFWLELVGHFKPQWVLLVMMFTALLLLCRQFKWVFVGLIVLTINGAEMSPWYVPQPAPDAKSHLPLRIYFFNPSLYNNHGQDFSKQILAEKADLVILQEANPEYIQQMQRLKKLYPYAYFNLSRQLMTHRDMAIWSRYPLGEPRRNMLVVKDTPSMHLKLHAPRHDFDLLIVHPEVANRRSAFPLRHQQMTAMSKYIQARPGSWIVIGDLNITPWSPLYQKMVTATGLHNTRQGFGLLPTWPVAHSVWYSNPLVAKYIPVDWLRLPIDHCLVSPDIQVRDIHVNPSSLGSDHFPLVIELAYPKK